MRASLLLPALALLLVGCEHADPVTPEVPEEPRFSSIQSTVFAVHCALSGCHAGASPVQGMDLSAGAAYDAIVGVRSNERPALFRVDPGNPDGSYLLMKIEGAPGIAGSRMPLGRPPLSDAQITLVRDWIAAGAPRE